MKWVVLKIAKEPNGLPKVLLEPDQKSNELSMNRKCEQSVAIDDRGTSTKGLGADKDKVNRDQTKRNSNKHAMFDKKILSSET